MGIVASSAVLWCALVSSVFLLPALSRRSDLSYVLQSMCTLIIMSQSVQAHSASFSSQQILTGHLVCVRGRVNPWGCRDDENTDHASQQLAPGTGETPVIKCEEFS